MKKSPYSGLPSRAFWSKTAAVRSASQIDGFYVPKFGISKDDNIATAGSCFAQHVGRALNEAGYRVLDEEPLPPIIPKAIAQKYGYSMYSGRYGNIYTVRQLKQLLREALHGELPQDRVWERDGRFFDAQRPNVEPSGLDSIEHVLRHREFHLARVREIVEKLDILVFTFGLTEAWCSRDMRTVFPTAPGTIAGAFDPDKYVFHNFRFLEIREDFEEMRAMVREVRPNTRFLVTVSPVPLTATATEQHVEVATSRSKATLRAVCAELYDDFDDVDYFPSYEIITAQPARGSFFDPNMRTVRNEGVATAMKGFLSMQSATTGEAGEITFEGSATKAPEMHEVDVVCEEVLLEEFASK
jgi:GSCFA family